MTNLNDTPQASPDPPSAKKNLERRRFAGTILSLVAFALAWYGAKQVVLYMRTPSQAQVHAAVHEGLEKSIAEIRSTLPKVLDEVTTLTDVKVDGLMMIYINEIDAAYQLPDVLEIENIVRPKVCASAMSKSIIDGASYRYEYWSAGPHRKFLGAFNISTCP